MLERLIHRLLPLGLCLGLLIFLRMSDLGIGGSGPHSVTIAVGFLLIAAFLGGLAAASVRLPRITGYLLVGVIVGPHLSGLLTKDMLAASRAIEGVAVALIALTAGGEIKLDWVRKRIGSLTLITFSELIVVALGVLAVVLIGRSLFPFMPDDNMTEAIVIAMVFGAIAVANSPTVTIAVIAENEADGPVSRTVLGVTVLKDVCVIVLFAIAITIARDALGSGGDDGSLALTLTRELGGSVLVGVGFGIGISLFLRRVGRDVPVFILLISFAIWQVATSFHLEALLIALAAGFWVENFSKADGEELIHGIERVSLPVYALFFAAAGAKVDLGALASMWPLALLLSGSRAFFVFAGTRLGTVLAKAEPEVKRYAWLGFISQAGVTLALATIVARVFPTWGADIQVIIVAMIALHELIGPIGFQLALKWAGETGKARRGGAEPEDEASAASTDPPSPASTDGTRSDSRPGVTGS
jgi:Kef-type K+ transport system membrane component KefB